MTAPTQIDEHDDDLAVTPAATVSGVGLFRRLAESEPVRLYLYGVLVVVLAVLVAYGVLTTDKAALWAALGAAVLAVPVTEGIRSQVTSPRTAAQLAAA
jgi:uncharacterized membrane protein (Fun14 family)